MSSKVGWMLYILGCITVAFVLYFFTNMHPMGSCRVGYSKYVKDSYIMRGRYQYYEVEIFDCIKNN